MAEEINLDYMVSKVGSKAKLAIFFKICRSAINQWEIFGGKNYVPQGRVYEFLSRKSEWDKPIKN
jgi:hypothetical protein